MKDLANTLSNYAGHHEHIKTRHSSLNFLCKVRTKPANQAGRYSEILFPFSVKSIAHHEAEHKFSRANMSSFMMSWTDSQFILTKSIGVWLTEQSKLFSVGSSEPCEQATDDNKTPHNSTRQFLSQCAHHGLSSPTWSHFPHRHICQAAFTPQHWSNKDKHP